jgi:hypothetical protein
LYKPGIARLRHLPKLSPVRNIAVRVEELGMVENIEELGPEICVYSFGYRNGLEDSEVGIADPRPAAERALSVSKRS